MRILIFIEYVIVGNWRRDAWSMTVVRGLASRGHEVIVACDGAHDLGAFSPARVIARKPLRTRFGAQPVRFQRWVERVRSQTPHDVSLSLTPLAPATVTLTAMDDALGRLGVIAGMRNPVSMVLEYLHEPLLPLVAVAERRVVRSRVIRRRLVLSAAVPGTRVGDHESIGLASAQEALDPESRERLREAVRVGHGIDRGAVVLLTSAMHPFRGGADVMLEGLAGARGGDGARAVLLVAGRYNVALHTAAARAGCVDRVRFLGGTSRMDAALTASDAAVVPAPLRPLSGTGRFIADALRVGLPVVASSGAPGVGLLTQVRSGVLSPGIVVRENTAEVWRKAIEMIMDAGVRARLGACARDLGRGLGMSELLGRLEAVLEGEAGSDGGR